MIQPEKIEELLSLSADDRRRVVRLLEDSLDRPHNENDSSRSAQWLRQMAGRYSGGSGNSASHADEILRSEVGKRRI